MKETLILLHGALGSKNQFHSLITGLEEYFDVHSFSFEGHGGNESDKEFSIQLFTENLIDYLRAQTIEKTNIFGYSMGGYVALNAALKTPEKIKKVLTLGTKFEWNMESAEKEVKMLNPIKIEEKIPHYAEKLRQEHNPQDWKKIMTKTAIMMMNMAKGAKLMDSDFKKINQEVTIGIGSLDNMVSYEESKYVSDLLPNSKLVKLDGVKHPIDKIETNQLINYIRFN
ncbi:alpha/beta fold hydrolase [Aquimarina litoralis]|uniref:alpha/beta fold hydrolase n=1 Tax=Aquimarina litoralis TaxID=584605 RepID=UPI001C58D2B6|nr:alpha/beta fold hydrolase [Aquimarina litoralis]MBW1296312.1 alpha/beta fold hydrolase [Aquimarina litoralis]